MEASKPSLLSPESIIRRVFSVKVKLSPEKAFEYRVDKIL
jgi:hypothetical protein